MSSGQCNAASICFLVCWCIVCAYVERPSSEPVSERGGETSEKDIERVEIETLKSFVLDAVQYVNSSLLLLIVDRERIR